jgi:hypothetical protein
MKITRSSLDSSPVKWGEHVTDQEYAAAHS